MRAMVIPGLLIAICAVIDIRCRTLPVWLVVTGGFAGIALSLYGGDITWYGMLAGMSLGTAILAFSIFSQGRIGVGDALLFMAIGGSLGVWRELLIMWISFLMAGVFGVIAMTAWHRSRDYELPFVPFLGAAYLLLLASEAAV